jgi:hypothetical protein
MIEFKRQVDGKVDICKINNILIDVSKKVIAIELLYAITDGGNIELSKEEIFISNRISIKSSQKKIPAYDYIMEYGLEHVMERLRYVIQNIINQEQSIDGGIVKAIGKPTKKKTNGGTNSKNGDPKWIPQM